MASDSLLLGAPQINTKSPTTAAIESSVETLNLSTDEPTEVVRDGTAIQDIDRDPNDDEDEPGGDTEQETPENNLNRRIDFSGIPQAFLAIIGATSIAAVEFHYRGAISSTALGRLIAIGVVGFLCCMASMLERDRKSLAAQIFGTIAVAAGSLEFLLLVSDNFSSYYGWMILGLGSLAIFLIFVRAYRR